MPRHARTIEAGMLRCSKCRKNLPARRFHKDSATPCGRRSACASCLNPKLKMVEPDYEVIPASLVKREPYAAEKIIFGSWERLVRHAGLLTRLEAMEVRVGSGYRAHYSAAMGIMRAAGRLRIKLRLEHWKTVIFVINKEGV